MIPKKDKLLRFVDEALAQARELSEEWTGTLIGDIIDTQRSQLKEATEKNDFVKALQYLADLAQTLNYAETNE